jgi:ABC-2 type transport system ATP-binding protein
MDNVITVSSLTKSFKNKTILNDVSFSIRRGSVVGLLGANGAGKTTLLQTVLGFIKADTGSCKIFEDVSPNLTAKTKHNIGYVAQEPELINWMKVGQMIDYIASFYGHWNRDLVESLLNEWRIDKKQLVEKLSLGQKQKLSIVLALGHEPEFLILDEPVASLDPVSRRSFIKKLIDMNLDQQRTIVFSTHITSDLERVAAEVMILKNGNLYYHGDIDELKEKVVKLHIHAKQSLPTSLNIDGSIYQKISNNRATVLVEDLSKVELDKLARELDADIRSESLNLEDIFVELHS